MNSTPLSTLTAPADSAFYVESTILPGLTLSDYRRARARRPQRRRLLKRLAALV